MSNPTEPKSPARTLRQIAEEHRAMLRQYPQLRTSTSVANAARERERLAAKRRQ